jgi:hypothetical protein
LARCAASASVRVASVLELRKSSSGAPDMAWARPAECTTASTPASAAAMFIGRARSPTTAPLAPSGTATGRRSSTRTR